MGRSKAPKRLVLTEPMLDYLVRCCTEPAWNMVSTDRSGDRRINLRVNIVLELLRMARFGKGLATLSAKSAADRSASAQKAADARWNRVRAQRNAAITQNRMLPF